MKQEFRISQGAATESRAVLEITAFDWELVPSFSASLHGPACAYARTLPARYHAAAPLGTTAHHPAAARIELVVPEPCYWTPALPFLYQLECRWRDGSGRECEEVRAVGLRRFIARRDSLYWNGERIVLRGAHVAAITAEMALEARSAEVALLVPGPSEEQCNLADLHGLPVIADVRESDPDVADLLRLASHPSVTMALIDGNQIEPDDLHQLPAGALFAVATYPADDSTLSSQTMPEWSSVIAVELEPGMRPPTWVASHGKPVIAIRPQGAYADLQAARTACDHLQAALAPEFDLAGYFV